MTNTGSDPHPGPNQHVCSELQPANPAQALVQGPSSTFWISDLSFFKYIFTIPITLTNSTHIYLFLPVPSIASLSYVQTLCNCINVMIDSELS